MSVLKMQLHKVKLLIILPLLASCSLTPLYQKTSSSNSEKACTHHAKLQIKVHSLSGDGYSVFKLKNILEQKKHIIESLLHQKMLLTVNITESFASVGIDNSGDAIRNQGRIAVELIISPIMDKYFIESNIPKKIIKLDAISSYNLEASDEFSNETAKSSVRERLLIDLSEQIIRETVSYLKR
jgi:hypothetical protein